MTIAKENPQLAGWWREMENKYEKFDPRETGKTPFRFFRDEMTIDEIIEESSMPFDKAEDTSKQIETHRQMALWDNYLDSNNGCSESCEAF
jgi:hypothetical protein